MKHRTTPVAALAAFCATFLLPATGSAAAPARIHYAEPVELAGVPAAGANKPTGQLQAGFEAFGRRFDLRLESNERVLERLEARERRALPAHALYKGTVAGIPGSWVRLTRIDAGIHGLVFDGRELYVLAPAAAVARELDVPLKGVTATSTVVFRAADATSGLGENFCETVDHATGKRSRSTSSPAYKTLFADLQRRKADIAAAVPSLELDLGLVGDASFASAYGNPMGEILARLNNVDGIYSSQVGVRIVSGSVTVLAENGPLTSTVPDMLLEQFESYRRATPALASRGLSHLVTGRDLFDSTVGIAYLNTLCAPQYAASLSQTIDSTYYSSLVFAHEIGHNFGAPHDGRNDSPCLGAGTTYLMAPSVNGNSNFSQCSLEQMAPTIAAANCLRVTPHADVAVTLPAGPITASAREEAYTQVDVFASGSFASEQVTLNLTGGVELVSGSVTNGTCTAAAYNRLACELGDLQPGARRAVHVTWRSNAATTTTLTATVASSNDGIVGNNQDTVELEVDDAAPQGNLVMGFMRSTTVTAGTDFDLPRFSVSSSGTSTDVHVELIVPAAFTIQGFSTGGAGCTINAGRVTCDFGDLSSSSSRNIALRLRANQTGTFTITGQATATNDLTLTDNSASLTVTVVAGSGNNGGGGTSSGGGGGGGGFDLAALWLLLVAPALAHRRRRGSTSAARPPATERLASMK